MSRKHLACRSSVERDIFCPFMRRVLGKSGGARKVEGITLRGARGRVRLRAPPNQTRRPPARLGAYWARVESRTSSALLSHSPAASCASAAWGLVLAIFCFS